MVTILQLLTDHSYLALIAFYSIFLKLYLVISFLFKKAKSNQAHKSWLLLLGLLITSAIVDFSWVIGPFYREFQFLNLHAYQMINRFAWGAATLQYLFLVLFLESLLERNYKLRWYHHIYIIITSLFALYCFAASFIDSLSLSPILLIVVSSQTLMLPATFFLTSKKIYHPSFPKILKNQVQFLHWVIGAFIFAESIPAFAFYSNGLVKDILYSRLARFCGPLLLTIVIYFSSKRKMGMRFLNYESHVQAEQKYKFVDVFKDALGKLGNAFQATELNSIVEHFFNEMFIVKNENIHLYIRNVSDGIALSTNDARVNKVEDFLTLYDKESELYKLLSSTKIWIKDELEFSDFYEDKQVLRDAVTFLKNINADIFLPIFDRNEIMIGYIVIDNNSRPKELYNDVERDEMLIFTNYLSNVIYLFQHKNLDAMIQKEKELTEELYYKHQEITQYKESIHSFIRDNSQRTIGLLFYKNRKFVFGNQTAHELVAININMHQGHPLTKILKDIAQRVEEQKIPQSTLAHDGQGKRLVISAFPHIEQNNVILMVYYPEISDLINEQVHMLKDPSEWDYALYLQTTYSGQLINKLIPADGPALMRFKIDLLRTSLSKKATLLELDQEDAFAIAEILHLISLRQDMHVLKLEAPCKNNDIYIKLCGMNPIFGRKDERPLLEVLHDTGTLYIQNIHFLDLDTQQALAEYIKYGFYKPYKSEQRTTSSVRIIASTTQDLKKLAQDNKFSSELLNELKKTLVSMPSLLTLPEQEFTNLAQGYVDQAIQKDEYKNLLELTDSERNKLLLRRPATLQEFKERIQSLLVSKSKKNQIEVHVDPAYNINDPYLAQAARLGKHALRDTKIMNMLWNKFKNQSKIATFLGVNRSSVNRKMRDLNFN